MTERAPTTCAGRSNGLPAVGVGGPSSLKSLNAGTAWLSRTQNIFCALKGVSFQTTIKEIKWPAGCWGRGAFIFEKLKRWNRLGHTHRFFSPTSRFSGCRLIGDRHDGALSVLRAFWAAVKSRGSRIVRHCLVERAKRPRANDRHRLPTLGCLLHRAFSPHLFSASAR